MAKQKKLISNWLRERYPVDEALALAGSKQVPVHGRSWVYMTGSVPLVFFMVQVVTGILLMVYYRPGVDTSHASVNFIMTKVNFGWLIRSIHSWGANMMILSAFIHMFAKAFTRSYRKPRELTWLTGIMLLGLLYGMGFVGYLLPWDQLAFFATTVGINSIHAVPVVGNTIVEFLKGGKEFTSITLTRFYTVHVMLLPLALAGFMAMHLAFLQVQGEAVPESFEALPAEKKKHIPFFPDFAAREMAAHFFSLAALIFLAVYFPWHLGPEASTLDSAPMGIKPEWYFYAQFQVLRWMPPSLGPINGELLGLIVINIGIGAWALMPFWARKPGMGAKAAIAGFVLFVVMTFLGWYF